MARDREHLELPGWQQDLARRRRGGGRQPQRDRYQHGPALLREANTVATHLQERIRTAPAGINPKLVFKIELHPQGYLDENQLHSLGLRLLAKKPRGAIVVFPNDAALQEMRQRLAEYAGQVEQGHEYAYLASIDTITELTPEDRLGARLKEIPLQPGEALALDIELWHSGDRAECLRQIQEIRQLLQQYDLRLTDSWVGETISLARARVTATVLPELLAVDYIKEIERRAAPTFEMLDVARIDLGALEPLQPPADDLVGVLVVDSGVMQGHPLLGPVLGDAQVYTRHGGGIVGGAEDVDAATGGHGTAVAGVAVFNDVGDCLGRREFLAKARVFSARVTDEHNEYDEEELLEHQLLAALTYFLTTYDTVKVVNISLGDSNLVYSDGSYQFRFAAAIDELAYLYRDYEVVFVVSSGNFSPDGTAEEIRERYPSYLLEEEDARLVDPATAALAITVGGISYGGGRPINYPGEDDIEQLIGGERGWPSPFTRAGWGVGGMIKPEVVDFAGAWRFERGRIPDWRGISAHAGLPTTAKDFAPPEGRLFRTVAGTSFAAPRVANIAAQLFRYFPQASSNKIRALIADSARVPPSRPAPLDGNDPSDEDILRIYGYGQPDFARARWSAENNVLLVADTTMPLDTLRLFWVPSLPQEFFTTRGNGYISVTLAFDPPSRHTRLDSYLGVNMEFALYRNVEPDDLAQVLRTWDPAERENLEDDERIPGLSNLRRASGLPIDIQMKPGTVRRSKGTLQRAICKISRANWQYNGGPLTLVVVCKRKWAPITITDQRFSVIVSLYHDDPTVDIYAQVQQQVRQYLRAQVRLQVPGM
jgi:hypothetical protein